MMKLLKNANVYTPSPIGKKDILIEGEKDPANRRPHRWLRESS